MESVPLSYGTLAGDDLQLRTEAASIRDPLSRYARPKNQPRLLDHDLHTITSQKSFPAHSSSRLSQRRANVQLDSR